MKGGLFFAILWFVLHDMMKICVLMLKGAQVTSSTCACMHP
jgi:hypothetical protein